MSTLSSFDPGFSTRGMGQVFGAQNRVDCMLDVEAAIAVAESAAGVIPRAAADAIVVACRSVRLDAESVLAEGWEVGTPVLPVLDAVRSLLDAEHSYWLHFGATTQDIVDTATMLQARAAIAELAPPMEQILSKLVALVERHKLTPVAGRTFLQPGATTSFGMIVAGWATQLNEAWKALVAQLERLPIQFGGPVGDLGGLGSQGSVVADALAAELRMRKPTLPWHANRTPILKVAAVVNTLLHAVAKMSEDLILLAQHGEVWMRSGKSSSMPAKQNPFDAVHAVAAARAGIGATSVITLAGPHELQRAAGSWHAEWWAFPQMFLCAAAAVEAAKTAVVELDVDARVMRANLDAAGLDPAVPESLRGLLDDVLAAMQEPA